MSEPTRQRRWTATQIVLVISLLGTVLLVGTEAGRLLSGLRVVGAVVGTALVVAYLVRAPRDHDLVDTLVLAGLVLFLVTCITSSTPRLSFEAATTALAYAAAFWVARGAVSDPRGRELGVLALGALGTLLGIMFVVNWGAVWIDWMTIAGGLPPLDLALPSAPYAGIHAAILAGLLLPATMILVRRRWLWPIGIAGSASLVMAIVMSGSRSVWVGLALGALALAAMGAGRVVLRAPRILLGSIGVITVAMFAVLGPMLLARIATGSTVELRLVMWGESVEHWTRAPLVGHGPGTFAAQFNLTDYYNRFEPWHTHPHNLVVQVLVESGVVGLVGAALILAALVIGVRRHGKLEWAALAAVVFIAGVGLTENATISAYLVAPLIVWGAMAAPRIRRDPEGASAPTPSVRLLNLGLAAVILLAVGSTLVAEWAHDRAVVAERAGNEAEVTASLRQAVTLDPAMALYRRELGVWLMAAGDLVEAEAQVRRALELNPADSATLRTLALVRLAADDDARALASATEAHRRADLHPENALTLAYVAGEVGDADAQFTALLRAVRRYPWLLAAPEWDNLFPGVDKETLLAEANESWADEAEYSHRNLQARTWLNAFSSDPPADDLESVEAAETAMLRCDSAVAVSSLGNLIAEQAANSAALQARLMVGRAFDGFLDRAEEAQLLTLLAAHNPGIVRMATDGVAGASAASDHNADVAVYGRIPIRVPIGPVLPTPESGLSAWLRDPVGAADVGAPGSRLATCR